MVIMTVNWCRSTPCETVWEDEINFIILSTPISYRQQDLSFDFTQCARCIVRYGVKTTIYFHETAHIDSTFRTPTVHDSLLCREHITLLSLTVFHLAFTSTTVSTHHALVDTRTWLLLWKKVPTLNALDIFGSSPIHPRRFANNQQCLARNRSILYVTTRNASSSFASLCIQSNKRLLHKR